VFDTFEDPRKVFGAAVSSAANIIKNIVILSADSGNSSGFSSFMRDCPERYFEFGIMEQGVTGFASGLAATGKIPIFCAIAPFVTSRPFEMFRNDLGYMRQNVKIVGRNSGVSYSDLGATHHSLEDFAIIRMIPGVAVLAPTDPDEIRSAVIAMIEHEGPVYMRIGNAPIPNLFEYRDFIIGRGRVVTPGKDVTLVSTGSITANAVEAAEELSRRRISVELLSMPSIAPFDRELLVKSAGKTGRVVTLEEHYIIGGLGTIVQEILCDTLPLRVKKLGLPHDYTSSGPYDALLAYYGLDAAGIANAIESYVHNTSDYM